MFPIPSSQKNRQEKQLIDYFSSLKSSDKDNLLAFAEFLSQRATATNVDNGLIDRTVPSQPVAIQRPATESVIKAIKRLTTTYPMVEKELLLHSISDLMTAHMMQCKKAEIVIDELEALFLKAYENNSPITE